MMLVLDSPPLLMFLAGAPGALELLVVFALVLVLFGPRKLPGIARMLGRALHELRRASEEFKAQMMSIEGETADPPSPPPEEPSASPPGHEHPEKEDIRDAGNPESRSTG